MKEIQDLFEPARAKENQNLCNRNRVFIRYVRDIITPHTIGSYTSRQVVDRNMMMRLTLLLAFASCICARFVPLPPSEHLCKVDEDCNHGICRYFNTTAGFCICDENYTSRNSVCDQLEHSRLGKILTSLVDRSDNNDWYVM